MSLNTDEVLKRVTYEGKDFVLNGIIPSGIKSITENGKHDVTTYASVEVNVEPNLITKEAAENGTYKASDEGADGYSEFVVNVASSGGGGSGGGDATPKIYGVSWTNDESTTMTRTDDAVGMSYSITNGRVTSDFDKVFPYNQMKRTVIDGNTFVFVPAMWFRVIADADKKITSVAVSSVKGEGDDWYPTRPFYYGAYGASSDGTVLKSVSRADRLFKIWRSDSRYMATNIGKKYHQRDLYTGTILMFLWWIEFANKNSQSIMGGAEFGKTTGNTDTIYNEEYGGSFCVSGYNTSTLQIVWHGIEDFVGNGQEWVDGVVGDGIKGGDQFVSDDYVLYGESTSKMTSLSFKSPSTTGYCLEAIGWDEKHPFLCLPITTRTDANYGTGFCDYATTANGVCWCCGSESPEYTGQGISLFITMGTTSSSSGTGCRLVKEV